MSFFVSVFHESLFDRLNIYKLYDYKSYTFGIQNSERKRCIKYYKNHYTENTFWSH